MAEVESFVLVADQLVQPTVFFEEVEIVKTGDEQHVADAEPHQVLEPLEAVSVAMLDPELV